MNNERRRKGKGQAYCSVPTEEAQTDLESSTSLEASPATGAKVPVYGGQDVKISLCVFRHPPVCRKYNSGNSCNYGNTRLYCFVVLRRNQARSRRKRVLKEQFRFGKKSPRLCSSKVRLNEV